MEIINFILKVLFMALVMVATFGLQACAEDYHQYAVRGVDTQRPPLNTQADPAIAAQVTTYAALNR